MINQNSVIYVAGGAGRIGNQVVKGIINSGGIAIIVDNNKKKINEIKRYYKNSNKVYFIQSNLNSKKKIKLSILKSLKRFKKIDGFVNCLYPISKGWGRKFELIREKDLKNTLFHQIGLALLFAQTFLEYFTKVGKGNIINIASIQGVQAPKFSHYKNLNMTSPIEYSIAKAGIIALTKYLSKYYRNKKIRINCISPGGIKDNTKLSKTFLKRYRFDCNSKGMLDAKDVVGTILFLLSDKSKFIAGQNIIIDDGWSL